MVILGRRQADPLARHEAARAGAQYGEAHCGLMRERNVTDMKRLLAIPGMTALILVFVLAGCGKTQVSRNTPGNTVEMAAVSFVQSSITVKAGDTVKFVDPSSTGAYHVLCYGHNQACVSNANGPAELNASGGIVFNGGDTKGYVFATAGTYEVTCTVHPSMNVTITVQ